MQSTTLLHNEFHPTIFDEQQGELSWGACGCRHGTCLKVWCMLDHVNVQHVSEQDRRGEQWVQKCQAPMWEWWAPCDVWDVTCWEHIKVDDDDVGANIGACELRGEGDRCRRRVGGMQKCMKMRKSKCV